MSWDIATPSPGSRLRAPSDGIRSSQHPGGWLARRWRAVLDEVDPSFAGRVARGRTLARGGRVRDLWFSPGMVHAEVVDAEVQRPTFRVRTFDEDDWASVVALLQKRLDHVAALLEGKLPRELVDTLAARGLDLLPSLREREIDGDCSCGDYAIPCPHQAAVHHVVADALDGEPFLLFNLRGRPREQLLTSLRQAWGDDTLARSTPRVVEEEPPEGDWLRSPRPLPPVQFRFAQGEEHPDGLLELGPVPGNADLDRALRPLYEAGAEAANDLALSEQPLPSRRPRLRVAGAAPRTPRQEIRPMAEETNGEEKTTDDTTENGASEAGPNDLAERLVDVLADRGSGAKSKELANALGVTMIDVRNELLELEKLGIVFRTGQTRGTRWWLG